MRRAFGIVGLAVALGLLGAAWLAAATDITGVEPGGLWVPCGPALVGRHDPLPHPDCAPELDRVVGFVWGLAIAGLLTVAVAVSLIVGRPGRASMGA